MDNFHSFDGTNLEKESNYEKVIQKRRSSIFQSRAIVFDECEGAEDAATATDAVKHAPETPQTDTFNLEGYIISLRNERKQWIDTFKQRKSQRRHLTKLKARLESQGQILDLSVLTDAEKAFVNAKPNYLHICKNYKRLLDMSVKVSSLHSMVYELNQRFISEMEGKLQMITEKIIEASA